jgi:hypothetical protein
MVCLLGTRREVQERPGSAEAPRAGEFVILKGFHTILATPGRPRYQHHPQSGNGTSGTGTSSPVLGGLRGICTQNWERVLGLGVTCMAWPAMGRRARGPGSPEAHLIEALPEAYAHVGTM